MNRNQRAKARDSLISFVNSISISDMDTVRTQAGMLSMLTSQIDEISRITEVYFSFFVTRPLRYPYKTVIVSVASPMHDRCKIVATV